MKNLIQKLIWFFIHHSGEYEFNKTYYSDLKYYDYEVYEKYKIMCLISFKRLLITFDGSESLTYHNIINKLRPFHQNGGYQILEKTITI